MQRLESLVRLADALLQGRGGDRAERLMEASIVKAGCDGELAITVGDGSAGRRCDGFQGFDEVFDGHDIAPDVEGVGTFKGSGECVEEDAGDIADILQVLESAVADVVGPARGGGLDRTRGFAGHAEITPHAVNGPGPQADAGDAMIEEVDPSIELVGDLEGSIMGDGAEQGVIRDGSGVIRRLRAVHGG